MEKQPDEPEDFTNEPLPLMSEPMEVQDAVASTLATPFAQPIIAASKSKAQKQREYRQRIAASRTPAQAAAARKSKNERQRNNRLRQAANLAIASGSLEATTTSSSRSGEESNNVQTRSQRQHAQQQSTTTADQPDERANLTNEPLFPAIPVPMEVQEVFASTSATPFAEPITAAPKTRAQIQREYRQRIAASITPAQAAAARKSKNERQRNNRLRQAANLRLGVNRPKKLSVLCKNVIKKYNLIESKQKFEEPSSSTIVGGKPLRDRTKTAVSSTASGSLQPPKKRRVNKDDVKLSDKKKGRPLKRLPKIEVYPRKEPFPEISVGIAKINPEPEIRIEVKLEPTAADQDPIAPEDEGFTVIVKEEFEADETKLVAQSTGTSDTRPMQVMVPNLVCSRNVAPSSSSLQSAMPGPPLMTVVGDEMQIFANSIAEQLRAFPLDRALLLQLEIQTMIDNERQLLLH